MPPSYGPLLAASLLLYLRHWSPRTWSLIQHSRLGWNTPHEPWCPGFIEQSQDQAVFGVVLDVSGVRGVIPGP